MITIHQHDEFGYYTGQSSTTTAQLGMPFRWSSAPLPTIPEGQFAQLNGDAWRIVDTRHTPAPPVPRSVSARQARLALHNAGLLADVEAAIVAMVEPDRTAVTIEWEYATTVERDSAWVNTLSTALGLTAEQLDDLFRVGSTL